MRIPLNLRNEFVVLIARRLTEKEVSGPGERDRLVRDTFRDLEIFHRTRIPASTRREILRTVETAALRDPSSTVRWADQVLKSAPVVLGIDEGTLVRRIGSGLSEAVDRATRRRIRTVPRRDPVAVKVCGLHDRPSALAALSAAREVNADNLVLGLLLGITHAARDKLANREGADLIRYIRETSYSLDQPVRIACVTHQTRAEELIGMIADIERRALEGPSGLIARGRSAMQSSPEQRGQALRMMQKPVFDIIQIHDFMPLPEIEKVKAAFPESTLIKAFHVPRSGEKHDLGTLKGAAVELARQPFIDGLLLDSAQLAANQIGGTGLLNDWDAARAIIEAVHGATNKPVALAGGLSPETARRAFEYTGADMIDANTGFRFDRKPEKWKPIRSAEVAPKNAFDVLEVLEQLDGTRARRRRGGA